MKNLIARFRIWLWVAFDSSREARLMRALVQAGLLRRWSAFSRRLTLGVAIFAVRDVITVNKLARDAGLSLGSIAAPANGAAFTQTNGQTFSGIKRPGKFYLLVYNSKAGAIIVTIKAGVSPPAQAQGLGDLSLTIGTTVFLQLMGPFDAGRFLQKDGTINVDTDAGATGTMWAFEAPSG